MLAIPPCRHKDVGYKNMQHAKRCPLCIWKFSYGFLKTWRLVWSCSPWNLSTGRWAWRPEATRTPFASHATIQSYNSIHGAWSKDILWPKRISWHHTMWRWASGNFGLTMTTLDLSDPNKAMCCPSNPLSSFESLLSFHQNLCLRSSLLVEVEVLLSPHQNCLDGGGF